MTQADGCSVKWCDEVGEHAVHRRYLASLPVGRGAWFVGVNIIESAARVLCVELTVTPRRSEGLAVALTPDEAEPVADAFVDAVERVSR